MATPQVSRKSNRNCREQRNNEGGGYFLEKPLNNEFELLQTLSRLSVKFRIKFCILELNSKGLCQSSGKEKESR